MPVIVVWARNYYRQPTPLLQAAHTTITRRSCVPVRLLELAVVVVGDRLGLDKVEHLDACVDMCADMCVERRHMRRDMR